MDNNQTTSSPSQAAAAPLASSIDNDMPISEVVAALKNTTTDDVLTEVKPQSITPTSTSIPLVTPSNSAAPSPESYSAAVTPVPSIPAIPTNPTTPAAPSVSPAAMPKPVAPLTPTTPAISVQTVQSSPATPVVSTTTVSIPTPTPSAPVATASTPTLAPTPAPMPAANAPKSPLYEDPDKIKVPGAA